MDQQPQAGKTDQSEHSRRVIMEHYRASPFRKALPEADFVSGQVNRSCGDKVELYVKFDHNSVTDAAFSGEGCSLCIAGASVLCACLIGLDGNQARAMALSFLNYLNSGLEMPQEQLQYLNPSLVEALDALAQTRSLGTRVPCVALSWNIIATSPDWIKT